MERQLNDRMETYDRIIEGKCRCGVPIILVMGSSISVRKDKNRYHAPGDNRASCYFRCPSCLEVIDETFIANKTGRRPDRILMEKGEKNSDEVQDLSETGKETPASTPPSEPGNQEKKSGWAKAVEGSDVPGPTDEPMGELQAYVGTKIVGATPMTLNNFQKKTRKPITDDDAPGYLVEYDDSYQSWSPAPVFERCYRLLTDTEKALCL